MPTGIYPRRPVSKATRLKMSAKRKGVKKTQEHLQKIALGNKGKILSKETRLKMSISKMGKPSPMKGKTFGPMSIETKKKLSIANKGIKSYRWRGGVTKQNKLIRSSLEYRLWRISVFERDNYTCIFCEARSGNGKKIILNADHIKPFAYFPELRFELSNGRTLCIECHKRTDTYNSRAKKYAK